MAKWKKHIVAAQHAALGSEIPHKIVPEMLKTKVEPEPPPLRKVDAFYKKG